MSDPVAQQARMVAATFRQKGLHSVADMIDYLADAADKQWDADSRAYESARGVVDLHGEPAESVIRRARGE